MYGNNNGLFDDFKDAFRKSDNGLVQLILINVFVFLGLIVLRVILTLSGFAEYYRLIITNLAVPASLDSLMYKPWTFLTYFFVHEGFFHILFNMLFLYWFGKLIVEYLGNKRVLSMYILGGLTGAVFFVALYNLLPYFGDQVDSSIMLGASAGVYAVVVGAATFMPNFTFNLILLGPIRIKYIAAFYVVLSFAQTVGQNAGGNLAHLGGALIGFLFIKQLQKGTDWGTPVINTINFFKSFFVKSPSIKVSYKKEGNGRKNRNQSKKSAKSVTEQDEIDAILDKISQNGYESLSKEEKQKLFDASKR